LSISFITHILETKGLVHSIERSAQVFYRYSFGRKRFSEMMNCLERNLGTEGIRVTFCITASLLDSHLPFLEMFKGLGHEFAAHGFFHTNMKKKSLDEQHQILSQSYSAFEKLKIEIYGFRCPYLSYNENTLTALKESQFMWTSNNVVFWDGFNAVGDRAREHIRKLELLYSTTSSERCISVPSRIGKLIDIPISAPDDEMLIERCRIRDREEIARIWKGVFSRINSRGELFHLLFHPERFRQIEEPLRATIAEARSQRSQVWFPTLNELTIWWGRRAAARWEVQEKNGSLSIKFTGPQEATLLVKSSTANRSGQVCGLYTPAPERQAGQWRVIETDDGWKHVVVLSKRCSPEVERFLNEEGFITARVDYPHRNSLYIDGFESFAPEERRMLLDVVDNSNFPLLRLWRWPHGAQSAFTVSSDVDSIDIPDFFRRFINF
jgi:peptidoglycan/xylan/chitin deacetylase (PgdA/CDA1 family)